MFSKCLIFFFVVFLSVSATAVPLTPTVSLYNGVQMHRLGVGTAGLDKNRFGEIISTAIETGFTLFDSAEATQWYDDRLLGQYLGSSELKRSQQFIVTKVFPVNYGKLSTWKSINKALENFNTDYLDLVLLHWPECWPGICGETKPEGTWKDAWKVLVEALEEGKVRAIGVSNFDVPQIKEATQIYKPHVVQNWMDPFHNDKVVLDYCKKEDIVYMGYSTLGGQWHHRGVVGNPVFENEIIQAIARERQSSVVEVVLKWGIQSGAVMIPRSNNPTNIKRNGKILQDLTKTADECVEEGVWLTEEQMAKMNNLPQM